MRKICAIVLFLLAACGTPPTPAQRQNGFSGPLVTGGGGGSGTITGVTAGTGLTGGGTGGAITLSLADTVVTPGSYTNTNLTIDQQGRITAAANGSSGGGGASVIATAATGTQNDWAPTGNATATVIVNTASSDLTINGLVNGTNGRVVTIVNNGTGNVVVTNNAGGSSAANRFANPGTFNSTLYGATFGSTTCSVQYTYLTADSLWHQTAYNCSTVPFLATAGGVSIGGNGNLTGVVTLVASSVNGTTVTTGGFGGSTWSRGAGVPGIACANGDLFSRTDGGVSTTLYVCTSTNTWTAK